MVHGLLTIFFLAPERATQEEKFTHVQVPRVSLCIGGFFTNAGIGFAFPPTIDPIAEGCLWQVMLKPTIDRPGAGILHAFTLVLPAQ